MKTYFARLTWNTHHWRKPAGRISRGETGTYVAKHGYGHEEWLNRSEWTFGGWRYAFIEPVRRSRSKREGQHISLNLFTISPDKQRWFVGTLVDAEVIDSKTSTRAWKEFKRRGWVKEMRAELALVGCDPDDIDLTHDGHESFNIRFRPEQLRMFRPSKPAPASLSRLARYQLVEGKASDSAAFRRRTGTGGRVRNPPWQRDELILALDLYMRAGRRVLDDTDPRALGGHIESRVERSEAQAEALLWQHERGSAGSNDESSP